MKKIWNVLTRPRSLLYAFIAWEVFRLIASIVKRPAQTPAMIAIHSASAAALIAVAVVALRNKKSALWIIGVYCMLSALGGLIPLALFFLGPSDENFLNTILFIAVGACFAFTGWTLTQSARGKVRCTKASAETDMGRPQEHN